MKTVIVGPASVLLTEGVIARLMSDRRVATKQRRARGDGDYFFGRRKIYMGRRAGDRDAHQERRKRDSFSPSLGNPLGQRLFRRKGDERRVRFTTYDTSPDGRIRALERRGKQIHFGRPYTNAADEKNAKAGFSGRSA